MTDARKPRAVKIRNQSYVKHYNIQTVLHVLEEWRFPGGFFYMYNIRHAHRSGRAITTR